MTYQKFKGIVKDSTLSKILNSKDMKITEREDDNRIRYQDQGNGSVFMVQRRSVKYWDVYQCLGMW